MERGFTLKDVRGGRGRLTLLSKRFEGSPLRLPPATPDPLLPGKVCSEPTRAATSHFCAAPRFFECTDRQPSNIRPEPPHVVCVELLP
jgi:hypothetical protein